MFVSRSRTTISELGAAIDAGESAAAARLAHGLKGSAAVVGAARRSAVSATLCEVLNTEALDEAPALQTQLERVFALTDAAFDGPSAGITR